MGFVADLHIHSKYSRATSKDCDLENLAWWGARKGISVIGTGDFTHPAWFEEISTKLVPAEPGLFRLRPDLEKDVLARLPVSCRKPVRFMLSVEISTIYKRDDRTRKVHHLIYMPDFDSAARCNKALDAIGNIKSDGRPILGLDSRHLLETTLESSPDAYLVPAHVWTPWFAVLGSQSGFDAIDDCYGELSNYIFALETGLSSDPLMNWRVSSLDRYRLVSNSDAHSPPALAREATIFDTEVNYFAIKRALEKGEGHSSTLEFFPEEGKYHLDGHRKCDVRWDPHETIAHDGKCSQCGKPVTVGVMHRVDVLADHDEGRKPEGAADFTSILQLHQIVGEINGTGSKTKRVVAEVNRVTEKLGSELDILLDVPIDDITATSTLLGEAIERIRNGKVLRDAGFDGEYGTIRVFEPGELERMNGVLFDMPALTSFPSPPRESTTPSRAAVEVVDPRSKSGDDVFSRSGDDVLTDVNHGQELAVTTLLGPVVVTAGPGTGKTSTIVRRFKNLVESGVAPERCLAVTFTRKAVGELAERLDIPEMTVTTFHGLGLLILKEHNVPVDMDVLDFDFDELIKRPLQMFEDNPEIAERWRNRFDHIAVDEYQDIDEMQYRLIRSITMPNSNLFVVGDPDQSIYSFRGANVEFFLRFNENFPTATSIELTNNYRSSAVILDAAARMIEPSTFVPDRELVASYVDLAAAESVFVHQATDERDEADFVVKTIERVIGGTSLNSFDAGRAHGQEAMHLSFDDIAVLYRTDSESQALLDAFEHEGIPAQCRSHKKLLDDPAVMAVAKAFVDCERDESELVIDVVARLGRQLGVEIEMLESIAVSCGLDRDRFLREVAMAAQIDTWDPRANRVSLLTMHAAKGLEFPMVFVVGVNEGTIPLRWGSSTTEEEIAEERRLLFVAMTRARTHLYLSHSQRRKARDAYPSKFLNAIPKSLMHTTTTSNFRKTTRQLRLL